MSQFERDRATLDRASVAVHEIAEQFEWMLKRIETTISISSRFAVEEDIETAKANAARLKLICETIRI